MLFIIIFGTFSFTILGNLNPNVTQPLTLIYDLDYQSESGYDHDQHTHNIEVRGQSVYELK